MIRFCVSGSYSNSRTTRISAAERIHSGFAGGQAKMAARLCTIVQPDSDGRSHRPAIAGRVRHAGTEFDADMTANPLATGGFLDRRTACGASLRRARSGLVAGLKLVGPRRFAKAKANSGDATADRNKNIAQIHVEPKRFIELSGSILVTLQ
jgi:hypothetical protein